MTTPNTAPNTRGTGLDHYRQAQNLLQHAGYDTAEHAHATQPTEGRLAWLAAAQVHATLALAAATALNDAETGMTPRDFESWRAVAGQPAPVTPGPS